MSQSADEFRSAYTRFAQFAANRTWVPVVSPFSLRLTKMDSASDETFNSISEIREYLQKEHRVELELVGGGYGCFDLGFSLDGPQTPALLRALESDGALHAKLNDAGVHTVRVDTPEKNHAYAGMYDTRILVATNRIQQNPVVDQLRGVREAFGVGSDDKLHFRVAEISITDLTKKQPNRSWKQRFWRTVTLEFITERFRSPYKVLVRSLVPVTTERDFGDLVVKHSGRGAVVLVHGYANDFDTAIDSCAIGAYKTRYEQLDRLPVLFSWPARGNPITYERDGTFAQNSQRLFLDALHVILRANKKANKDVDLMAHSHGNELIVAALSDRKSEVPETPLRHLLLVEPDSNNQYVKDRTVDLLESSQRMTLYHSENDVALWFAQILHTGFRAGQTGIDVAQLDAEFKKRLEVINASAVARGLMKHAPHIDSIEVIRDIHDVLNGHMPPRFGIREADTVGYWEMRAS